MNTIKNRINFVIGILLVAMLMLVGCQTSEPVVEESPVEESEPAAEVEESEPAEAPEEEMSEGFTVGYSAAGLIDVLQVTWSEEIQAAVASAGGETIIVDSQNSIEKQIADIEDLLIQGIDALVINPVDDAGIGVAIKAANAAGVPVITVDRNGGEGDIKAKVGSDNYQAGFDAGEYCAEVMGEEGEVAQIMGMPGGADVRDRGQGFRDSIEKYPEMEIVFEQHGDWDTAISQALTEDMFTSFPDVQCIWTHADAMIMGSVNALREMGKLDDVTTIGMGMYAGGPESIADGELTASWYMWPELIGQTTGEVVVKILKGEEVDEFTKTPLDFVTIDNIAEYLDK